MKIWVLLLSFIIGSVVGIPNSYAIREPRALTIDARLKTLNYHPYEVYKFTGYFYFQSIIEFSPDETINTISVGLPDGWQIQPTGNRIFIKPIADTKEEATTNMTVITDKRMYFFELHADEAKDVSDQGIPFIVRFIYPTERAGDGVKEFASSGPDMSDTSKYNFNYSISGPENISPVEIFDDGKFTYLLFRENAPIPGIFEVDSKGYEALINYRMEGKYVVVERITSQFTLRYGPEAACVFNESMPLQVQKGK